MPRFSSARIASEPTVNPVRPTNNDIVDLHTTEVEDADEVVGGKGEHISEDMAGDTGDDQAAGEEEARDELRCMPCEDQEGVDAGVEEEAEVQRAAVDPGQPTRLQREEHNLTHFPFRSWCRACVLGRAKDSPSRTVKGAYAESVLPRVRMDYCFLTENVEKEAGEHGEAETARADTSITVAVMQESLCKSVWAYAVESKGSMEEWMVQQVCDDLATIGLKNERLVLKSDEESSIVDVMKEIQKTRECEYGSALDQGRRA